MKPIRIAIAGLGFGRSVHLQALRTNDQFNVVGLWHPNSEKIDRISKEENIKGYYNWDVLIKDKDIDAIIIATPPSIRHELAKTALSSGKHLLLEKPVALESGHVAELQSLAIRQSLSVAVNFEYRAVPHFQMAKKLLDENKIGNPWLIKFDWLMSSRANKDREFNWYSNEEEGGGVIGALGTHAFDIIHWFFGHTTKINGMISTSIKERKCNKTSKLKEVTSEDVCIAQLEVEDNNKNIIPTQINLSAICRQGRGCWIEIYGSKGTLILGSDNQKDYVHGFGLWYAKSGDQLKPVTPEKDLLFTTTWKDGRIAPVARIQKLWANSINKKEPIIPGLNEGYLSQIVCDKLKEASKSGITKILKEKY